MCVPHCLVLHGLYIKVVSACLCIIADVYGVNQDTFLNFKAEATISKYVLQKHRQSFLLNMKYQLRNTKCNSSKPNPCTITVSHPSARQWSVELRTGMMKEHSQTRHNCISVSQNFDMFKAMTKITQYPLQVEHQTKARKRAFEHMKQSMCRTTIHFGGNKWSKCRKMCSIPLQLKTLHPSPV